MMNEKKENSKHLSCGKCYTLHRKCSGGRPCEYCKDRNLICIDNPHRKKRGRPKGSRNKQKNYSPCRRNKMSDENDAEKEKKKRGRPKGSKNRLIKKSKSEEEILEKIAEKLMEEAQVEEEKEGGGTSSTYEESDNLNFDEVDLDSSNFDSFNNFSAMEPAYIVPDCFLFDPLLINDEEEALMGSERLSKEERIDPNQHLFYQEHSFLDLII